MADMVFNNIDFDTHVKVEQIRRDLLPPRTVISTKIPNTIGSKFARLEQGVRAIEIDIRLIENDRQAVQEKVRVLAGLLHTDEPKKLILRDDTRYNLAILSDTTPLEKLLFTGFTTLTFLCLDPLAYSSNEKTIALGASTEITNDGTYEVGGVVTVNVSSSISYLELLSFEKGEKVYIEDSFIAGDLVIIDLTNEFVKKNDVLIMDKVHIISDFFKLPVGTSTLKLSSGTGTLVFREAWL